MAAAGTDRAPDPDEVAGISKRASCNLRNAIWELLISSDSASEIAHWDFSVGMHTVKEGQVHLIPQEVVITPFRSLQCGALKFTDLGFEKARGIFQWPLDLF